MLKILDGKIIRDEIILNLKNKVKTFQSKPTLAIIQVGDLEESNRYIKNKKKFAEKVGIEVKLSKLKSNISSTEIKEEIQKLNKDKSVHGIILQLPIPKDLDVADIIESIDAVKDVDGLTSKSNFTPATTRGILTLLDYYKIEIAGKNVVVMGRSRLVGQPTAQALSKKGALVKVVHSQTENPKDITQGADVLIVAIGKANLIDNSYISIGQTVIDVGINISNDGAKNMIGDVDFEKVKNIISAITPVPGGIGPLTVASLFLNLVEAYENVL